LVAGQSLAFRAAGATNIVPSTESNDPDLDSLRRQLQESQDRFRTLTENAFDLICEIDERGVYRYLSPNHRQVLGWDVDALVGQDALNFIHPDQRQFIEQRLAQAVREGSGCVEVQVQAANGEYRWFETTGQSYRTAGGELRFVVISRDVTDRRAAQDRLRREQEYQRRLLALQDADRRLMAYEIHDGLVQDLYGAQLFLESVKVAGAFAADDAKAFKSAVELLRGAIEEARRLINGLRPPILDERGLIAALEHLAHDMEQTWGVCIDFHAQVQFDRLSATVENAVYRIVQECLNNVQQHSDTDRAQVELTHEGNWLRVAVSDRGKGFDPAEVSSNRYGLAGIRERTRLLGGEAQIDSRPGAGVTVVVRLPLFDLDPLGLDPPSKEDNAVE
jgi:PAS domain S-box-containing protein